jgi:hypothetical protein
MKATVRPAVAKDADAIARLHILTWQAAYRAQIPDSYLDGLSDEIPVRAEFWRNHIASQSGGQHEVWVTGPPDGIELREVRYRIDLRYDEEEEEE